jgi:hypothetical protein
MMSGHFVALAPFFVQADPLAFPIREVIFYAHCHDRSDAGEGVGHHVDQRAVAQSP